MLGILVAPMLFGLPMIDMMTAHDEVWRTQGWQSRDAHLRGPWLARARIFFMCARLK